LIVNDLTKNPGRSSANNLNTATQFHNVQGTKICGDQENIYITAFLKKKLSFK